MFEKQYLSSYKIDLCCTGVIFTVDYRFSNERLHQKCLFFGQQDAINKDIVLIKIHFIARRKLIFQKQNLKITYYILAVKDIIN